MAGCRRRCRGPSSACGSRRSIWLKAWPNRLNLSSVKYWLPCASENQARQDAAQFRQQAADALAGRHSTESRLADLELLLDQRLAQIGD